MEDLVSIIVPAYNSEKYIGECIKSVLNQSYKKWELIIVNDNSSDHTVTIVDKFALGDSRIKLYSQDKNMGAAAARNKAIQMSSGRYIAFLDSDDLWKKDKLKKQISFMQKNQYAFTFTAYDVMKDNTIKKVFYVPKQISYKQYLKNTIIGNLTVVMDQKLLGKIVVETGELEDVLTWMKYLKTGIIAYGINENLATYRVSENSVSGNKIKNALKYFNCLRKVQNLSLTTSVFYELNYLWNAIKKRVF